MSTRLSGFTKDTINGRYKSQTSVLQTRLKDIENEEINRVKSSIRNCKEFNDLLESAQRLKERVEKEYPDFYWYSDFRSLFNFKEYDNKDFGYLDSKEVTLSKNKEYTKIKNKIKTIEKEKNSLLFKLENAPIKSKDYEEAYYKLKEILNEE